VVGGTDIDDAVMLSREEHEELDGNRDGGACIVQTRPGITVCLKNATNPGYPQRMACTVSYLAGAVGRMGCEEGKAPNAKSCKSPRD
jgi:hypothetical protein